MAKNFTWERGPFEQCPSCNKKTFGFLSAGGDVMTLRCTDCRYSHREVLPEINKATIYLDQFMFSSIFKIKAGGQAPLGHHEFYAELIPLLRRLVLLQQAILPHSDLHSNETIVFNEAGALREAYEDIGGDGRLKGHRDVELSQVFAYAKAYRDGTEPELLLEPDAVLENKRNAWLRDIRISVNTNYARFADGIRREREAGFASLKRLVDGWADNRPTFHQQLRSELQFGKHRRTGLAHLMAEMLAAQNKGDWDAYINLCLQHPWREYRGLREFIGGDGSEDDKMRRVIEFWDWRRNNEMPFTRIFAHLFAAFSRRVVGGQRKFTRGFMTDVQAIAAYAPYVDAMFVDKECAALLDEEPLRSRLLYRARIFSYANGDAFLSYLRELEQRADEEVRYYAERIYGLR